MLELTSARIQKERLLPGIHGLRGVAATAVALYHLIHIGGVKPPQLFDFIGRDFGYSVHLFFILSAFSLMYSTEPRMNDPDWLSNFFIKRFFRIAPLFYVMIAFYVALGLVGRKDIIGIILNVTFTFGLVPPSGFLWGGWSIGVEMVFYVIFPLLLLLIKTQRSAFILLIISIIVGCALRSALHFQYASADPSARYDWSYFSFASNISLFSMGIYAYILSKSHGEHARLFAVYAPITAALIIGGLLLSKLGALLYNSARFDIVLWGIGLSALCVWQSKRPSTAIANNILEYVGERSYSIYLIHPVILYYAKDYLLIIYNFCTPILGSYSYFICASIVMLGILAAAEITYRMIEVPGITLGRGLILRWKRT